MVSNTKRNFEILIEHLEGASISQLAAQHGLRPSTVSGVLTAERHKLSVSPAREYLELRQQLGLEFTGPLVRMRFLRAFPR